MKYKYENSTRCIHCHKMFDWYYINLHLIPPKQVVTITDNSRTSMYIVGYNADNLPIFEGQCPHCKRLSCLSESEIKMMPDVLYSNL